MITIREMLELDVLKGASVLAGDQYLYNTILGITSFDSPDGYKWLRKGEFVLTTGYPFVNQQDLKIGLLNLVQVLLEKECSGLAIKLGRYVTALPEEVIHYATQNQFPILSFPMDMAWSDAIVPIITSINNKQRLELERTHAIYELFHQHLITGGDLPQLAELLYRIMQVPVTIYVKAYKKKIDAPANITNEGLIHEIFTKQLHKRKKGQDVTWYEDQHMIRWLHKGDVIEGGIILWNITTEPHPWEKVAIEQTAALITLEIARLNTVSATYQRFRNDFLTALINGTTDSREGLIRKAEEVGWKLGEHYHVAVMDYVSSSNMEIHAWKEKLTILELLQIELSSLLPETLIGLDGDNRFVLLIPAEIEFPFERNRITKLESIIKKIKKGTFYIGLGRHQPHHEGIYKSYREASLSLKIAINSKGSKVAKHPELLKITFFSDLDVERILYSDTPQLEAKLLASECLSKIMQYDIEKNGQLLDTLQVFLENNSNYAETAAHLFIHKNTIKYRFQLIHELSGRNPEYGKDQLLFRLALSVKHTL